MSVYTIYIYVDLFLDGIKHVINVINQQSITRGVPFPLDLTVDFFKAPKAWLSDIH